MSDPVLSQLRVLSFGAVDGALWAVAVDGALVAGEGAGALVVGEGAGALVVGEGAGALVVGEGAGAGSVVSLDPDGWSVDGDGWRLAGDGVELTVEPRPAASPPAAVDGSAAAGRGPAARGVQELCRVRGSVRVGDRQRAVDCSGARVAADVGDGDGFESVRAVCGWLADDEGFALLALRPRRHRGQESDVVAATLFDPQAWVPVADPRLSTTYDGAGVPARVNLELWIGDGDTEFPRRVAGEAVAPGAVVAAGPAGAARAQVVPLRCHSQGHEGFGAYILASL